MSISTTSETTPLLRRASNSFKHGLYAKKLTYSVPSEHQLYQDILHDYVQHYRPITPDEETLVQQLAALQFRHLKVQTFHADSMRAEVLRQCKNAALEADGSMPTETAIETRAFEALCEKSCFRLYIQELNRLPNKIQRTIDRIHILIRLRPEIAAWSINQPTAQPIAEPAKSEETPQPLETNTPIKPLTTKEAFIHCFNHQMDEETRQILLYGAPDYPGRASFFRNSQLTEANMWKWATEAAAEGLIVIPPNPDSMPKAA